MTYVCLVKNTVRTLFKLGTSLLFIILIVQLKSTSFSSSAPTFYSGLWFITAPQIWFLGQPRILFPVSFMIAYIMENNCYPFVWYGWTNCLYFLIVSLRLFTLNFSLLVSLSCIVTPNVDVKNLIFAALILFLSFSVNTQFSLP